MDGESDILSGFMPVRTCTVTLTDVRGVRHSVEVQAESLFEAAGQALAVLKAHDWVDAIGPATPLDVKVAEPTIISHQVTAQ